jgi:subtilisin family serine protease
MLQTSRAAHLRTLAPRALLLLAGALLLALSLLWGSAARADAPVAAERATAHVADVERKPTGKVRRIAKHSRRTAKVPRRARKVVRRAAKPRKPVAPARPVVSTPSEPAPPNDPLWRDSWALAKANAPSAWRLTTGRPETVVAVLDTGVDLGHPDLQGAFVAGYDVVNHDEDPSDDHGHGTMVAGVIAARSNNELGVTSACWRCSLMPVKVIGADGTGNAGAVAEGIVWAAEHGAHVINLSFTMNGPDDGVAVAIEHARSRGVVVVAAAGNNGTADPTYPAAYPGVVSVAGTDSADGRYAWSSYGGWVRLAAPGCNLTTAPGGTYGEFCGTSSATAFVSGFAGLVRSLAGNLSADEVAQALSIDAVPAEGVVATGRLNGGAALGAFGVIAETDAASPSGERAGKAVVGLDLP